MFTEEASLRPLGDKNTRPGAVTLRALADGLEPGAGLGGGGRGVGGRLISRVQGECSGT